MVNASSGSVPLSDPTPLTTDALEREIKHARELVESDLSQVRLHLDSADEQISERFSIQIADIRRQIEAKFTEQDRAVQAALVAADKAVTALENSTSRRMESLQELNDSKFITYRTLLDSQADKVKIALEAATMAVDAAFAASKEAIKAAFDSSKEAIAKAETYNEKRFDSLTKQIDELKHSRDVSQGTAIATPTTANQIADLAAEVRSLRDYREKTVGKSTGTQISIGWIVSGIGALATVVVIVNVIIALATK